jgi:hypothetical protein
MLNSPTLARPLPFVRREKGREKSGWEGEKGTGTNAIKLSRMFFALQGFA